MNLSKPEVLLIAAVSMASTCLAQPKEPCFAFLLKGDVTAICEGKTTQITHRGDIENFAVSDASSALAYITSRITKNDGISAVAEYTATVVNLEAEDTKRVEDVEGVVSTCGGILPNHVGPRTSTRDLVTGEDLKMGPYVRFRCSADRRVVAGVTSDGAKKSDRSDLYEGVPPSTRIAAAEDVYIHYFNVSPDGSKVAWFNDERPLCVLSAPGQVQCVNHSATSDPVSINNSGEVLAATGTRQGCFYKTPYNFSPPRRGERANDECSGIGYWKAGLKSIVIIQSIGRNPQWISPQSAKLLNDWSRKAGNR